MDSISESSTPITLEFIPISLLELITTKDKIGDRGKKKYLSLKDLKSKILNLKC